MWRSSSNLFYFFCLCWIKEEWTTWSLFPNLRYITGSLSSTMNLSLSAVFGVCTLDWNSFPPIILWIIKLASIVMFSNVFDLWFLSITETGCLRPNGSRHFYVLMSLTGLIWAPELSGGSRYIMNFPFSLMLIKSITWSQKVDVLLLIEPRLFVLVEGSL